MSVNNRIKLLPILAIIIGFWVMVPSAFSKGSSLRSHLLDHAGKSYTGAQDPAYVDYDSALRDFMVDRIRKQFGVELDPKTYSGFDLLEIEALFKCKKPGEPFDIFLKIFPKNP